MMEYEEEEDSSFTKWDTMKMVVIYRQLSVSVSDLWLLHELLFTGSLVQHEIARVDENFEFTYSNNENNDTVWPGELVLP